MIHYYYGDGKGKTTAAMGLALRALGRGMRVFIVQFLKSKPSGEALCLDGMDGVTLLRGKGGHGFASGMTGTEREATERIHNENLAEGLQAVREGRCDMLVLDEVGDAYAAGLLDGPRLLAFLRGDAARAEVVMTGHAPEAELLACADYVTRMQKEKHPYDSAVAARSGVEF